ncbi:unnamed protein product [Victoria cruziana]
MYQDHLDGCGLEEAIILSTKPVNGSLVHAVAERWNPRTSTFWFPWGEMTVTLDEFSDLMGLPLSKEDLRGPIKSQYLINEGSVDVPDVIKRLTGKRNWPMLEKNHQKYIRLKDLAKEYSTYVNPTTISRKRSDAHKQAMLTTTVGLVFFYNGEDTIDLRVAGLLRSWGQPKSRRLSIAMAALAFLYRGLNLFVSGVSEMIEGSNPLIQAWFLKHAGLQASQLQAIEGRLTVEYHRRQLQDLDKNLVVWDYFDRKVIRPRHTFHSWRGSQLLEAYFTTSYHPERCVRQVSQRQKDVHDEPRNNKVVEFELDSPNWSAACDRAQNLWDGSMYLPFMPGPLVGQEYEYWWNQVLPYLRVHQI